MTAHELKVAIGKVAAAVAVFAVLVNAIADSRWWLVAAIALAAAGYAGYALVPYVRDRRASAGARAEELAYQANRQARWTRRGDSRAIYGQEGAELMRRIDPMPLQTPEEVPSDVEVATIAETPEALAALLSEKPWGWRWAAFASVLVQRRSAVRPRTRDVLLCFATPRGARARNGPEVAAFVWKRLDEMADRVKQMETFMLTPAFMAAFGSPSDELTADGEGIVHNANRLMDYHERFLVLAEQVRDLEVPSDYAGLIRDCVALMRIPLEGYEVFTQDFIELIDELPDLMMHSHGVVELEPIQLHLAVDDELFKRVFKQIRRAGRA